MLRNPPDSPGPGRTCPWGIALPGSGGQEQGQWKLMRGHVLQLLPKGLLSRTLMPAALTSTGAATSPTTRKVRAHATIPSVVSLPPHGTCRGSRGAWECMRMAKMQYDAPKSQQGYPITCHGVAYRSHLKKPQPGFVSGPPVSRRCSEGLAGTCGFFAVCCDL